MGSTPNTPINDMIAQWVREHSDAIIWILIRKGFTRDEAEDALQDAWRKVARYLVKGATLRATTPAGVRAWLFKIALRMALESRRKIRLERGLWSEGYESTIASTGFDPLTELCRREDAELIESSLNMLSRKHANAIYLYRKLGKKSEVAKYLGISNSAAGKLLERAIGQYRLHLNTLNVYVD